MILITINWWLADENDHIEVENFIQASFYKQRIKMNMKHRSLMPEEPRDVL